MGESDRWYYTDKGKTLIKVIITIVLMAIVVIGLSFSPKFCDVQKNFFQRLGILLSFVGFLLMLVSGITWQPKEGHVTFFVSSHQTNFIFVLGVIFVCCGFFFQAMGLGKIPF